MNAQAKSTDELLLRATNAVKAGSAESGRINTERWIPVVDLLRRRNWSYAEIYAWLKDQGEPVHDRPNSFVSAVSRRYRRWLETQRLNALSK